MHKRIIQKISTRISKKQERNKKKTKVSSDDDIWSDFDVEVLKITLAE